MVWLANFGPALVDDLKPIKTMKVGNVMFDFYSVTAEAVTIFTYVATESINRLNGDLIRFNGDLMDFFKYLPNPKLLDNQFLVDALAGTSPSYGKAKLIVSKYSLEIISKPSKAS